MKRFFESEQDYQHWLLKFYVTDDVLDEIEQTYDELYHDLFNNPENLSKHKNKWIIFKAESTDSFINLVKNNTHINLISDDFKYTNMYIEDDNNPDNPIFSVKKLYTKDIKKRNSDEIYKKSGDTEDLLLPLSRLRKEYNTGYIKYELTPKTYYYYIKITRDIKEITHMSTDKAWTSCMRINKHDSGVYAQEIIKSIKKGLLVAYTYKLSEDDLDLIDNSDKQFGENAVSRISINPYQSNTKFLYLKAMKRYAGNNYLANEPFDLQEEVQDYLDKHFNFGVLDSEDIFYADSDFYNDLDLVTILNNPFDMIEHEDLISLKKYLDKGKNLDVINDDGFNLLSFAIDVGYDKAVDLLMKYDIKVNITDLTLKAILKSEIKRLGDKADLNHIDVSNVEIMDDLFSGDTLSSFNGNISKWNVSNVKSMHSMFKYSAFDSDISKWDVSNVDTMTEMFSYGIFNQNINNWDVSSVTTMESMFKGARYFDQELNDWDVKNVSDMTSMFRFTIFNQKLNKWNVKNVMFMDSMFRESKFNQDISDWKLNNIEMTKYMFNYSKFNQNIDKWNLTDENIKMDCMFRDSPLQNNPPIWYTE